MSSLEAVVREIARDEIARALSNHNLATREWFTSAQAADYLGVARGTIHNAVSQGRLPRHGQKGHRLVWRRDELDAYLRGERGTPNRASYNRASIAAVVERNREFVDEEAERRGGFCEEPGCSEPYEQDGRRRLDWHHRDPETKEFGIAHGTTMSLDRLAAELEKCDLLCVKHHKTRHRETAS